jgi:hypothetical protein
MLTTLEMRPSLSVGTLSQRLKVEGLNQLRAHVLPWGGGEVDEGFEDGLPWLGYFARLGRTRLLLLVGPYVGQG